MTPAVKMRLLRWVKNSSDKSKAAAEYRDEMICEALADGLSIREVAAAAGLSPARVHQIRHGK